VAEWLGTGLQIRLPQFDSGRRLWLRVNRTYLSGGGRVAYPAGLIHPPSAIPMQSDSPTNSGDAVEQGPSVVEGKLVWVQSTSDQRETLATIAQTLVEQRQAACVQISGPVESWYRWEGKIQQAAEWLLTFKTTPEKLSVALQTLRRLHHYSVPQMVCREVAASDDYLQWAREQVDDAN